MFWSLGIVALLPFISFLPELGPQADGLKERVTNCETTQFLMTASALAPLLGTALVATAYDRVADLALRSKNGLLKPKLRKETVEQHLKRTHWVECVQWLLFLMYIAITFVASVIGDVFAASSGFTVLVIFLVVLLAPLSFFVIRWIVRDRTEHEGEAMQLYVRNMRPKTYAIAALQFFCFMHCIVFSTIFPVFVAPVALRFERDPCPAINETYVQAHCEQSTAAFVAATHETLRCDDGGFGKYRSTLDACRAARTLMLFLAETGSALLLSLNLLFYLIFTEVHHLRRHKEGSEHSEAAKLIRERVQDEQVRRRQASRERPVSSERSGGDSHRERSSSNLSASFGPGGSPGPQEQEWSLEVNLDEAEASLSSPRELRRLKSFLTDQIADEYSDAWRFRLQSIAKFATILALVCCPIFLSVMLIGLPANDQHHNPFVNAIVGGWLTAVNLSCWGLALLSYLVDFLRAWMIIALREYRNKQRLAEVNQLIKDDVSKHQCTFTFVTREAVLQAKGKTLPRMQELDASALERFSVSVSQMCKAHFRDSVVAISHRWEDPKEPDPEGDQLRAVQKYLEANREVQFVWYDYWCMPQGNDKSAADKKHFDHMLKHVNLLYLGCSVLVLMDVSFVSRFWTLFEAWLSMQQPDPNSGLRPAVKGEERWEIEMIHNASQSLKEQLLAMVGGKSPAQVSEMLSKNDIAVTNQKDKKMMLEKVKGLDEEVRRGFEAANERVNQS